jgi:hypothetical protein
MESFHTSGAFPSLCSFAIRSATCLPAHTPSKRLGFSAVMQELRGSTHAFLFGLPNHARAYREGSFPSASNLDLSGGGSTTLCSVDLRLPLNHRERRSPTIRFVRKSANRTISVSKKSWVLTVDDRVAWNGRYFQPLTIFSPNLQAATVVIKQ